MQDLDKHLSQYGLTYQQFNILRILKGQYPKGVKLSLLQDRMLHKQSDVSRLVNRLVKQGMVDKKEDETNKRRLSITLSPFGYELIHSIDVNGIRFQSVMSKLNEAEMEQLNLLFDKILRTML